MYGAVTAMLRSGYGLSWLKVLLESDERYRPFLLEAPSNQSAFRGNL
jgi:hypothetical protein